MKKFTVTDLSTGIVTRTNGTPAPYNGIVLNEINDQTSVDDLSIVAHTSDVCILTGSGNDTIDASRASGHAVIDAGAGMNFITGGSGATTFIASSGQAATVDTVSGFHVGDCFTLNGAFALAWADTPGVGTTVTASQEGMGSVQVSFVGLSQSQLFTTVGHGGAQFNILQHA